MSKTLRPGENIALEAYSGTIIVTHDIDPRVDVNLTAFLLTEAGKVQGDSGVVYYNQPQGPGGMACFTPPADSGSTRTHKIDFDLKRAPVGISRMAITLTEDQNIGFASLHNLKAEVRCGQEVLSLIPHTFSTEKGLIVLEVYVRNEQCKAKAIWQGFSTGLAGLCQHYGVDVADTPAPAAPKPTVNLQKVSGKIDLSKGQKPIIIEKTPEIIASISWSTGTDYDVYALILTRSGQQIDVATFGAEGVPPLSNYKGAVIHMGDVGRSAEKIKTETLKIRLNDDILAVVPVAYSAQSNGTGSFHRYQVTMTIDNQQGTVVTIPAQHANNNDFIYTCVPGMIKNLPDGVMIEPIESYSQPNSENRPKLILGKEGHIDVRMDAGPENIYK